MRAEPHGGPQPFGGRTDFELESALRQRLAEDRSIDDSTLVVTVSGDKATVAGEVPDRDTLERVHAHAARVPGVREIDNVLTIAPGGQRQGREVVRALERKLEDAFPSSEVRVRLVGSTAVLEGHAEHFGERDEIERTVQGYARIDHILNHIRVL